MVDCTCVCVCECTYKQGVGGSFKNSNKKGLLGWPRGAKKLSVVVSKAGRNWKRRPKIFFFLKHYVAPSYLQ